MHLVLFLLLYSFMDGLFVNHYCFGFLFVSVRGAILYWVVCWLFGLFAGVICLGSFGGFCFPSVSLS